MPEQYLFRSPSSGDGDPPEWTPPDYATVEDKEKWKPPSYATIEGKEDKPKSKGILDKIKDFIKPEQSAKPVDLATAIPAQAKQFLDEHPTIKAIGRRILEGPESKAPIVGDKFMEIPGVKQAADYIRQKSTATGNYGAGFAGSIIGDLLEAGSTGFDPRTAGAAKAELPVRQASREIPYRVSGELPESEASLAAKTPIRREDVPRDYALPTDESVNAKDKTQFKDSEEAIYENAKQKFNMGQAPPEEPSIRKPNFVNPFEKQAAPEEQKPTAKFVFDWPEAGGKQYQVEGGEYNGSTVGEDRLKKLGIEVPKDETPPDKSDEWKPPSYAESVKKGDVELGSKQPNIIEAKDEAKTPESLHPQLTALKNYGDGVLYLDFDKTKPITPEDVKALFPDKNVDVNELFTNDKLPSRFRVDIKGKDPVESNALGDAVEHSVGGAFDNNVEMMGGLGGIKPSSRVLDPNKGPYGAALDKLFNSMGNIQESRLQQDILNKAERSRRFGEFSSVKEEGALGASKSLSALKGEFDKVDYDKLKMTPPQVDSLFTGIKRANITPGEKARGYTALFKLLNGSELPQRSELRILDDVFGNDFGNKILELHGGLGGSMVKLSKVANTMKSMQNAISLAAPLRHGIGLVARKEFYPAFSDMFKFFANKEYYDAGMQALEERPNYLLGRESGLFLSKPNSLASSEEEFLNSYVGQIPLANKMVAASQRGYTGFLNKLRADTFDSMISQMKGLGYSEATKVGDNLVPSKETEAIARFINNATGRGSLGPLNKMTNELNMLLWSPRMISSRINMLANPKIYTDLPKGMRIEGLKSLLGIAALGTTIDTLAAYGGAKVTSNILSTDAAKARFGKDVIDPWGGFQQYIVAAARFLAGFAPKKTELGKAFNKSVGASDTSLDVAGRFLKNKESPAASLAHELLTAKFTGKSDDPATAGNMTTQYGQKTSIQTQIGKQFVPIFIQDLNDLIQSNPKWSEDIGLTSAMAGASLAGMAQQYPEKKKGLLSPMRRLQ